jgi:chemotaxis protein methyltransferase CheR
MSIARDRISELTALIHDLCGIYLGDSKLYLIDSRFGLMAKRHECDSYDDLARLARRSNQSDLRDEIVNAITTNETLFFRDNSPFEAMRHKILPDYIDQVEKGLRSKRLNIWSAAASTGQEAYSVAMTLREVIPNVDTWAISIFGTDVSPEAIEKAKLGIYSELEISRGLNKVKRSNFFESVQGGWQVSKKVRDVVHFENRNLLDTLPEKDCFDIVLCRNVAIYGSSQ